MPVEYRVGQRVSFKGHRCTVRYIGAVEGTDQNKIWLGVEWDDPARGKHNGEYLGRSYFKCKSASPTAASFVNLKSARADPEQSFVEAVRNKYALELPTQPNPVESVLSNKPIVISTKEVQEVGFDKIRAVLAQLHELKIVLVDGLRINKAETPADSIKRDCPKIVELDLSRNLFDSWEEIVNICGKLQDLRILKVNENRLDIRAADLEGAKEAFRGIRELELDNMSLGWEDILSLSHHFESLTTLSASLNNLTVLDSYICGSFPQLSLLNLTSLTLEYNKFTALSDLIDLKYLPALEKLSLKGNEISEIFQSGWDRDIPASERTLKFPERLHYVDLSYNAILSWGFVDGLADVFPGMTALRLSHNPINQRSTNAEMKSWTIDEAHMITVARLGKLNALNYSTISPTERTEAETYYLSQIAKAMAEVPEGLEHTISSQHKRYAELCKKHGIPDVIRKQVETVNPDFLEARLIKFTFYMLRNTQSGQKEVITKEREIPKGLDVYRVKGLVGRMFDEKPMSLRLIWETGAMDPVAGSDDIMDDDFDEDLPAESEFPSLGKHESSVKQLGRFVQREVEIEDSTRHIGNCIDGMEARVRVELR